jgi:hypothetical protein
VTIAIHTPGNDPEEQQDAQEDIEFAKLPADDLVKDADVQLLRNSLRTA